MDDKQTVYGVDVAKAELVIGHSESEVVLHIANTAQGIAAWLVQLPAGTAVAMEASGHYHQLLAHMAHAAGMRVYVASFETPAVLRLAGSWRMRASADTPDNRKLSVSPARCGGSCPCTSA